MDCKWQTKQICLEKLVKMDKTVKEDNVGDIGWNNQAKTTYNEGEYVVGEYSEN